MKRLKSSRLVKTICFLLCILFTAGVTANIILGLLLQESNVFYAEKDQLNEILLEDVIEHYNQTDITNYLRETIMNPGPGNPEIEIYRNKFSKANSNLSFTVTDEAGNTLLYNDSSVDKGLTFTKTIQLFDYDYSANHSDWVEETETEAMTTKPGAGQDAPTATGNEETTVMEQEDTTAAAEPATSLPEPTTLPPQTGVTEPVAFSADHVYILDDGSGWRFRYYYDGANYNEAILQYCTQIYETKEDENAYAQYDGEWMTFYENDFAVSDNGMVYFVGHSHANETWADLSGDTDSFPHKTYTATYTLPKTMEAKDLFYYAQRLVGFAYGYIHKIIPLTIIYALAAVLFYILLLFCAGHVKGEDSPKAKGLHRIPYDLVCAVIFTILISLFIYIVEDGEYDGPLPIAVASFAFALTGIVFIETTIVRCKAKTIGKNFLFGWLIKVLFRIIKKLIALFRKASENTNLFLKIGAVYVVSGIAEFIYSFLINEESEFVILMIIWKVVELPLLALLAVNLNKLQTGAKRLSEGNVNEKIDPKYLFGEFKKNADYLNSVSDGVNSEVQKRMKSESMKTELITNVSHDLKTPLTSIINYVDLLKGTEVTDPKAQEYIEVIDRQSQRLKKLCADIVDASKAATGNLTVNRERTVLNVMLGQVIGEYDARLSEKSLQLISEIPQDEIAVQADGRLLWRVFDNLMGNICKYAMEGTRVYLSLGASSGMAQITFRNISGAPLNIPPEEITERFVRGDTSRNTDGSGLGLSIAKSLTELMGGQFDVSIDGDLFKVILHFPATA